jgi:hypothetical protein
MNPKQVKYHYSTGGYVFLIIAVLSILSAPISFSIEIPKLFSPPRGKWHPLRLASLRRLSW